MKAVADQWINNRLEGKLNEEMVRKEIKKMELKLKRYNVSEVVHMKEEKRRTDAGFSTIK